jgi:phage tail sheath protein FI
LAAIRQFANPKEQDINVFATPGIDYVNNKSLVGEAVEMIEEERADSIYVITTPDKPYGMSDSKSEMYTADEAVANLDDSELDSNWACTYFPWIKYYDSANSQYIYLPPTKDVVKNFAYTDNVAAPWYAAAGWNRGLSDGIKSKKNLVLSEQDELYSGRINFINNFAEEGMRIWGDKNLQIAESNAHMNRISKRRCLIRLRKLISIACIGLVFDPNDATQISSFRSAVQPILEDFISKRALNDAYLKIDDSPEALDRLEINAQIYLKFTPNTEYINIGLVATPQGVSFDDI